jgi:hypothetical protein
MNADGLLAARDVLELNNTVNKSEESVVSTDTDVLAGMNRGASLSDDDVAGLDRLTVGLLHAETLSFAVTSVLSGADALFMGEKL